MPPKKKNVAKAAEVPAAATATAAAPAPDTSAATSVPDDAASTATDTAATEPVAATAVDAPVEDEARATQRRSIMPEGAVVAGAEESGSEAQLATVVYLSIEAPSGKSVKVETTPSDCVLDVRQFLLECPETAEYTSYHLEASFGILNDYLELADYPQLCTPPPTNANGTAGPMPTLKIVPDLYDERAARLHVRRLRELLVKPPAQIQPSVIQAGYEDVAPGSAEEAALIGSSTAVATTTTAGGKKKNGKKGGKKGGNNKQADDEFAEFAPTANANTSNAATPAVPMSTYTDAFSLTSFYPAAKQRMLDATHATLVDSVKHLGFSGWNPPPGNRRLQGDLLYLELTTAEGVTFHITANPDGFFVNQSSATVFSPERAEPQAYKSLTLVELLRKVSPTFAHKYTRACARKIAQHPFEAMEVAPANALSHQWLAQAKAHTLDWNRSEDALSSTYGMDQRGVARDWNEEAVSCRELPKSTLQERVLRDRTMYRVYSDFVDAATKGAVAVVHGHIPPVNPMDAPRAYVFIYNSIFFSFAVDAREMAEGGHAATGDRVSYQMANQDLHGVRAYSSLDIDDLYTLSTVLVDYRGHRVIAQSIIPGIFAGDRASKHVYGSMDVGKTIEAQPDFHALMLKAAKKLHIKPHAVLDAKDEAKELAACVESKGIIGSDGRSYILDLLRAFPRDANFLAPTINAEEKRDESSEEESKVAAPQHPTSCLLRPELVAMYCHTKAFAAILPSAAEQATKDADRRQALAARVKAALEEAATKKGSALTDEEKLEVIRPLEEADVDEQRTDIDAAYTNALEQLAFNPDALTGARLAASKEEIAADEDQLRDLARFLKEEQLGKLIKQLRALEASPVDTQHLTQLLHEHGINLRYLSSIIALAQQHHLPHIEAMAQQECIVRAAKHIFNAFLRAVTPAQGSATQQHKALHANATENLYFAPLIAKFLNSAFGTQAMGHKLTEEQMAAAATIVKAQREEEARERQAANQPITIEEETDAASAQAPEAEAAAPKSKNAKKNAKKKAAKATEAEGEIATTSTSARDLDIRLADGSKASTDPLSSANLWTLIRLTVQEKFSYELPAYLPMTARSKLCMLRSFCLKTGVQLQCRDYDLAPASKNAVPFTVADILDLFPIVKAHLPTSADARDLLESGKACLQQGNFGAAYQFLTESLNLHHQVYGPMHRDSANVYATLALTCFQVGEYLQAIDFQQRAIIIYERVLGLDSYETAHAHMHQALFLQQVEHVHASLKHMQRALWIFELIAGPNHPDTAAAHMNAAMLQQEASRYTEGLKHLETALERNQLALGPEHAQVALAHHAMAVGHALVGAYREAVRHEKMCKSILLANAGSPKDREVLRSHFWLEHFTALAVKHHQLTQHKLAVDSAAKGKKAASAAANASAAAAASADAAQAIARFGPQALIPPQLKGMLSPLTWVSLHSQVATKGKLSMSDVMQLLEATTKATSAHQQQQQQQQAETAAAEVAPDATATEPIAASA